MKQTFQSLSFIVLACSSLGCGGGLNVEPVATGVQRPSQVAVYLSVRDDQRPVTDLTTGSFVVFEDGQQLDAGQVELTLLDRNVAATHHTVLLVDTSALGAADAGGISRGVELFAEKVSKSQSVGIYAFDGSTQLRPLGKVARGGSIDSSKTNGSDHAGAGPSRLQLAGLGAAPSDPSRDLNGALLRGLEELDTALSGAERPVRVGTLVVFTRGPDLAGRVSAEQLDAALERTHAALVTISVGNGRGLRLDRMGRDGVVSVPTLTRVERAFEQGADRVAALEHSHYLLAYCSPSRAGERKLRVEVRTLGAKGESVTGSFETAFDARGFSSGCDPKAAPQFVVTLAPGAEGPIPAALPQGVEPAAAPSAAPDAGTGEAEAAEKPAAPSGPPVAPSKRRRPSKSRPPPDQPPSDFEP